jgi:hypothetical protein
MTFQMKKTWPVNAMTPASEYTSQGRSRDLAWEHAMSGKLYLSFILPLSLIFVTAPYPHRVMLRILTMSASGSFSVQL